MNDRAKDIVKRHEERKKHRRPSQAGKGRFVAYHEIGEKEDHVSYTPPQKHRDRDPSHVHTSRHSSMLFRIMIAIILLLAVGILFKSQAPAFDGARAFVQHSFQNEFQFAKIGDWYEKQFGKPLALFPKSEDEQEDDVTVDKKTSSDYAEPVNGTVKQDFSDTEKGVLLKTGDKEGVKAIQEGIVVSAGKEPHLGKVVKVEHSDGTESWYGKLDKVDIKLYDFVKKGEKIGTVSLSKKDDQGTFYFALKKGDAFINPLKVISFD